MKIVAVFLFIVLLLCSCGGQPDASKQDALNDKTQVEEPKPNIPESPNVKLPEVKFGLVTPYLKSQVMTSMALVPPSLLRTDESSPFSSFVYMNLGKIREWLGLKKDAPKERTAKLMQGFTPPFVDLYTQNPQYPIEDPQNWYWSVSDFDRGRFWLAGDMKLDGRLFPAIKPLNTKTIMPKSGYAAYVCKETSLGPRYGMVIVPFAKDFAYFSPFAVDFQAADDTAVGLLKKAGGIQAAAKNVFPMCGEPLVMLALNMRIRSSEAAKFFPSTEQHNGALKAIQGFERHPGLQMVTACHVPDEEYPLRIVLNYESESQAREDMPLLAYIWNNKNIRDLQPFWDDLKIVNFRFSINLNCGIIEMKSGKNINPLLFVGTLANAFKSGAMCQFLLR